MKSFLNCVIGLLLAGSMAAQSMVPAKSSPYAVKVVAKMSFTNQTASIPATTIYTPPTDGDFTVTAYAVLHQANPEDADAQVGLLWTDEIRSNFNNNLCDANNGNVYSSGQMVIHAKSGVPIQFLVAYGTNGGNVPFDVFVTVLKQ